MAQTTNIVPTDVARIRAGAAPPDPIGYLRSMVGKHVLALAGASVRATVEFSACVYLVGHTIRESALVKHAVELFYRGLRVREPIDPRPDTPLDCVDLASWESFPASDSPGY